MAERGIATAPSVGARKLDMNFFVQPLGRWCMMQIPHNACKGTIRQIVEEDSEAY
jgi:hypothetical protein